MYFSVPLNDVKARVNVTAVLTSLNVTQPFLQLSWSRLKQR